VIPFAGGAEAVSTRGGWQAAVTSSVDAAASAPAERMVGRGIRANVPAACDRTSAVH